MGLDAQMVDFTSGQMLDWRLHRAYSSLMRGMAFPIFYFLLMGVIYSGGFTSFDAVDGFFLVLIGILGSFNTLTFARTHNRRYARFPLRTEDAAAAVERALNSKFLTYRRKDFFPPSSVRGVRLITRYVIDMNPVSVAIADAQGGCVVCIGPETEKTEEQMMMLTIAVSNELGKRPSRETDQLGEVPFIQGLE